MKDLVGDYRKIRPQYENFTDSLANLIRTIIKASGVEYFSVEPRTKTESSFEEKIQREDKVGKYKNVFDVTDLSGVRIIAYLQEDCDKISDLIGQNFTVDRKNSVKKSEELDPDKFGYLSTHYVISLPSSRTQLIEFSSFKGMKAEIQVRTLLQHTWAAIDWKFRYKEEQKAPKTLRRRLFRISALLEAADNEFSAVKKEIDDLQEIYKSDIKKGDLDIAINSESLKTFIKESDTAKRLIDIANKSGIKSIDISLPQSYSMLVATSDYLGLHTLNALDKKLQTIMPEAEKFYSALHEVVQRTREGKIPQLMNPAVLRYALFRLASPTQRRHLNRHYAPSTGYADAITQYVSSEGELR